MTKEKHHMLNKMLEEIFYLESIRARAEKQFANDLEIYCPGKKDEVMKIILDDIDLRLSMAQKKYDEL